MRKTIAACAATALLAGAGTATAASLVTGKQIKNGTIHSVDIHNGSVTWSKLSSGAKKQLAAMAKAGPQGATGASGATGPQGATGPTGATGPKALPDGFARTNNSLGNTANGVEFGPYPNGGVAGGSLRYSGLNGKKLSDISKLTYTASYSTDDDTDVGVPYLRVFLNGDQNDVIFSPNTQPSKQVAEDTPHTWDVTAGTVRYDDDAGNNPDQSWASVVAAHGTDTISGIYVSVGFSAGQNLTAWLTDLDVNASAFHFGD